MHGFADVKTNVLSRDEKGMFGIPFKKLMTAAVVAVMCFTLGKALFGPYSLIAALLTFVLTLLLTSERGGLPRYQRLFLGIRGSVIMNAFDSTSEFYTQLAELMQLNVQLAEVDADELFTLPGEQVQADLKGLVVFASPFEAGRGTVFVDDPVQELLARRERATHPPDREAA